MPVMQSLRRQMHTVTIHLGSRHSAWLSAAAAIVAAVAASQRWEAARQHRQPRDAVVPTHQRVQNRAWRANPHVSRVGFGSYTRFGMHQVGGFCPLQRMRMQHRCVELAPWRVAPADHRHGQQRVCITGPSGLSAQRTCRRERREGRRRLIERPWMRLRSFDGRLRMRLAVRRSVRPGAAGSSDWLTRPGRCLPGLALRRWSGLASGRGLLGLTLRGATRCSGLTAHWRARHCMFSASEYGTAAVSTLRVHGLMMMCISQGGGSSEGCTASAGYSVR